MKPLARTSIASARGTSRTFSIFDIIVPPPNPKFFSKTSMIQLGIGVWINMSSIVTGLSFGFTSVGIPMMKKDPTIQLNLSQESWIGSAITLFAPVGSLLSGYLMDIYGRKPLLVLCEIPVIVGWFLIGYAKSATYIIIGRAIAGFGLGSIFTVPRAYLTEISLPNMRGAIGSMPNTFLSFGLLVMAGFAIFLDWHTISLVCGIYSILLMIFYLFLPETPYFVLMYSPEKATEMLKRFRSNSFDVETEIRTLLDFRQKNDIRSLTLREKMVAMIEPSVYKPFFISIMYIFIVQLSGTNVIIMWNIEILELSHIAISPKAGNIVLCVTRMVVGIIASIILFRAKRRVMALISAIGVGITCLCVCVYLHKYDGIHMAPLYLYMACVMFSCLGYYTLPFMMMSEMLPLQHRGFLCGVIITVMNFMMFGMNKSYPYMREAIGLANVMAVYGGISLLGSIVLFFILPETSVLTLQEIEEYFNKRRPALMSSRQIIAESLNSMSTVEKMITMSRLNFKSTQNLNLGKGLNK